MRKASDDDLSEGGADTGSIGDGFQAVVDLSDTYYGDSFDDDYTVDDDSFDRDSADGSFDDELGAGDTAFGSDLTEDEAEEVLEDMFDDVHGSEAGEVVDDLQEATGLSAVEILEDIIGTDASGGSDDGFDPLGGSDTGLRGLDATGEGPETTELDMATKDDFDLNHDGQVDGTDVHEASHLFGFDIQDG